MSNGKRGDLTGNHGPALNDFKLSKPDPIDKITIFYKDANDHPWGYKLYNKAGECLLSQGTFDGKAKETILKEGERIVGFKSRLYS